MVLYSALTERHRSPPSGMGVLCVYASLGLHQWDILKCAVNFTEIEICGKRYKHDIWWVVCLLKDWIITKLMSRRHADNWSHPGHYLVDPYNWPWSPNGHRRGHEWPTANPFVQCQSALPFWDSAISKVDHENPWSRSCVRSKVKVTFDRQKSKVKVMVTVKHIGHIWGLKFNQYVCFLFRGNRTTFGWGIGNSIFDLENSKSRSWLRSNLMVTFEALGSTDMFAFRFVAIGTFLAKK